MDKPIHPISISQRNAVAIRLLHAIGFEQSNILKALPKLTGLTHQYLAERIGVTRQAVSHTMSCERNNPWLQEKLSVEFNVPVDEMFHGFRQTEADEDVI